MIDGAAAARDIAEARGEPGGLQMLVSYTYSRTDDNVTPATLHPLLADVRMPALSKAIDIPQIFVVSATYELQFGPGKPFAAGQSALIDVRLKPVEEIVQRGEG